MPRTHVRLLTSIWNDQDWRALTTTQQQTYLAVLSSEDLSWCGAAPLLPQRLVKFASDLTERKVRSAIGALTEARFFVVDEATAEVLVRSYVRHDGILKQPNVTKAMVAAIGKLHSDVLHGVVVSELGRLLREEPPERPRSERAKEDGWQVVEKFPDLYAAIEKASRNPFGNPSRNPLGKAS
jgi:hypothetical protein